MSQEHTTGLREGWVGTVFWALLVVASITLMSLGLLRALFFGFTPEPALVEDARVGGLHLTVRSGLTFLLIAASMVVGRRRRRPRALNTTCGALCSPKRICCSGGLLPGHSGGGLGQHQRLAKRRHGGLVVRRVAF